MSILIDDIILYHKEYGRADVEINGKWYLAKPWKYPYTTFIGKLKNMYRILIGKSMAVHFKEDEE